MKFVFCLLLLMVVEGNSEDSFQSKNPINYYINAITYGYMVSKGFQLEEHFLKNEKVKELFTSEVLETDKYELAWHFNAIIGIQISAQMSFHKLPNLMGFYVKSETKWREYLNIIMNDDDGEPEKMKEELEKNDPLASFLEIAKSISTGSTEEEEEELKGLLKTEIAVELLLTVVPKKQQTMFLLLLNYFQKGYLNDVYDLNTKPDEQKMKEFDESQLAKSAIDHCMFNYYNRSLDAGQRLTEELGLLEKVKSKQEILQVITIDTLEKKERLKWCLESLIGIEAALSNYFRKNTDQKKVFDSAVNLWKNNNFGPLKTMPSTLIGDASALLQKIPNMESKFAFEEIIEEASRIEKKSFNEHENKRLSSYLKFRMSVYLTFPMVAKQEGRFLKKVFRYFQEGNVFNDIVDKVESSGKDILEM